MIDWLKIKEFEPFHAEVTHAQEVAETAYLQQRWDLLASEVQHSEMDAATAGTALSKTHAAINPTAHGQTNSYDLGIDALGMQQQTTISSDTTCQIMSISHWWNHSTTNRHSLCLTPYISWKHHSIQCIDFCPVELGQAKVMYWKHWEKQQNGSTKADRVKITRLPAAVDNHISSHWQSCIHCWRSHHSQRTSCTSKSVTHISQTWLWITEHASITHQSRQAVVDRRNINGRSPHAVIHRPAFTRSEQQ